MPDTVNHYAHQLAAMAMLCDEQIDKAMLTPQQLHHLQLCIDVMHSTASFLLAPQAAEHLYRSSDDAPIARSQAAGLTTYLNKPQMEAA